ncbi:MAG: hypothetical protein AAF628_08480 [Planctomycetota bacterium]
MSPAIESLLASAESAYEELGTLPCDLAAELGYHGVDVDDVIAQLEQTKETC